MVRNKAQQYQIGLRGAKGHSGTVSAHRQSVSLLRAKGGEFGHLQVQANVLAAAAKQSLYATRTSTKIDHEACCVTLSYYSSELSVAMCLPRKDLNEIINSWVSCEAVGAIDQIVHDGGPRTVLARSR
jgi:hypothetical protein